MSMLVVFRGLPGTGKSHLVSALVQEKPGFLVLSRDTLRASMFPHPTFGQEEKNLVDDVIVVMTEFLLARQRDVVIDGMALSSSHRVEQFARAAESRGALFRLIQCVCAEKTALDRIARGRDTHPAGDRGEKLYLETRERFEPVPHPFLTVDTDENSAFSLALILGYLSPV